MSIVSWYWFRVHYANGHSETVATLDTGIREAWTRQWASDKARTRYAVLNPKRGWKMPPRITKIDVLREPSGLGATEKGYLDETLRLVNNPY
jgi:hypothetical protein